VKHILLLKVLLLGVRVSLIGHAAIHWAYGSALWLFVEANTLGALVGDDVVDVHFLWLLSSISIGRETAETSELALDGSTVCETPFGTTFVDGVVGAFRFACTAVDALVSYLDGHERSV